MVGGYSSQVGGFSLQVGGYRLQGIEKRKRLSATDSLFPVTSNLKNFSDQIVVLCFTDFDGDEIAGPRFARFGHVVD